MALTVSADDIVLDDPTLKISVKGNDGDIEEVSVRGLPARVKIVGGEDKGDGRWSIPPANLKTAKLEFEKGATFPDAKVAVTVKGKVAGETQTADANFTVSMRAAAVPYRLFQKVLILALLLVVTIPAFLCWRLLYRAAQDVLTRDKTIAWVKPPGVTLKNAPITFWYQEDWVDPETQKKGGIHHRGPIDAKLKQTLVNVAKVDKPAGDKTAMEDDARLQTYLSAIDGLTYKSNEEYSRYFLYLLAIAGLSGVLGTQLRSLSNFVYIATVRPKDLDAFLWWPYYVVRPVIGFLLGLLAVLLIEAKIYVPETQSAPTGTVWWMGIAMLIGFAVDGFSQRLRLVGQAVFGETSKKEKQQND